MAKPLIDTNTFLAVASVFDGPLDPWARPVVKRFADAFIYADKIRFTVPTPDSSTTDPTQGLDILKFLYEERRILEPVFLDAPEPMSVSDESATRAFEAYVSWATRGKNTDFLAKWLETHLDDSVLLNWHEHFGRNFVFEVERFKEHKQMSHLLKHTNLDPFRALYAFDNILRYPEYGRRTGANEHYLNHPLRSVFPLPEQEEEPAPPPPIPISWADSAWYVAQHTDLQGFFGFLESLRFQCRNTHKLHEMGKFESVDSSLVRDIAANAEVPGILRGKASAVAALTGAATIIASGLGPLAAVVTGTLVTIAGSYWKGSLPRGLSRVSWMRWVLKWSEENQAKKDW